MQLIMSSCSIKYLAEIVIDVYAAPEYKRCAVLELQRRLHNV